MEVVLTLQSLETIIAREQGLLLYFSNESCSVCKVLKPKVSELITTQFPGIKVRYVDTEKSPMLSGQHRVFTIPTLLLFFQGKEHARFSRNISLYQLEDAIGKPYKIIFGESA